MYFTLNIKSGDAGVQENFHVYAVDGIIGSMVSPSKLSSPLSWKLSLLLLFSCWKGKPVQLIETARGWASIKVVIFFNDHSQACDGNRVGMVSICGWKWEGLKEKWGARPWIPQWFIVLALHFVLHWQHENIQFFPIFCSRILNRSVLNSAPVSLQQSSEFLFQKSLCLTLIDKRI